MDTDTCAMYMHMNNIVNVYIIVELHVCNGKIHGGEFQDHPHTYMYASLCICIHLSICLCAVSVLCEDGAVVCV